MFGHLQVYSCYSFQKSTILIPQLVKQAKDLGLDCLALCDYNNMHGIMEFYDQCLSNNINPILGLTASISVDQEPYPFVLLARDDLGYECLIKINNKITIDQLITIEELREFIPHIYIISSNEGIIESYVSKQMNDDARRYMILLRDMFGDSFYIMIQKHNKELQNSNNEVMKQMASSLHVKVICSNDVRYLHKEDALAVDLLECASKDLTLTNFTPKTSEKYLKSEAEMLSLFDEDIIEETRHVMANCKARINKQKINLPKYPVPKNGSSKDYLFSLCRKGLMKRFGNRKVPVDYIKRLYHELDIIHKMGFDDYFLIVWDYVTFAKKQGIMVGPGRGSAAGSLVAYSLGITNVDPIRYDLLFERFLNPERVSMPDIDIDFQDNRRDEVIAYVEEKYGLDHVASIVTFSTYGPRTTIREMGKVIGMQPSQLNRIANKVPNNYKNRKSLRQAYELSSFRRDINNTQLRYVFDALCIIEHLPKNISMHAAGIILSDHPLKDAIPLVYGPSSRQMSQYSKKYIEEAGFIKMDFLGLKNLTVLDYILKDIEKDLGSKIILNDLPLDDLNTYKLLGKGDTYGVFQLESDGMRDLLIKMQPESFNDIVDAIALYRPGPMEFIPSYLARRRGEEEIDYFIDDLKPILESTYGIMIYQEQIMMIATKIAGFSMGKADLFRKAISDKKESLMISMKDDFISGCLGQGYSKEEASQLFERIEKFANYGFNKSHSVAYAYIAYQLAYLKANQPLYFYGAILSNEQLGQRGKVRCIQEVKNRGIKILSPSINYSSDRFTIEDHQIRYSLIAIKDVGMGAYKEIEKIREEGLFKDIYDFFLRIYNTSLKSTTLEALIKAGAFDEFGYNRKSLLNKLDELMSMGAIIPSDQLTINDDDKIIIEKLHYSKYQLLEDEKEVLGHYLSGHPIELEKEKLETSTNISDLYKYINKSVKIVAQIQRVKRIQDRNGQDMCFINITDETGSIDGIVFNNVFLKISKFMKRGTICLFTGRIKKDDPSSMIIDDAKLLKG